jgi:plastocyanin
MKTEHFAAALERVDGRNDQQRKGRKSMRAIVRAGVVVAFGLNLWGCSGSGYGSGTSGNPSAPTSLSPSLSPSTSGVVTVNVVGINGALSFSPNPATLPAGQMIVWHNVDNITHHVVFNDGSVDTGNLGPGASSQPQAIAAAGSPYHCSIHPVMVGSVNQDTTTSTPTQSPSQGY